MRHGIQLVGPVAGAPAPAHPGSRRPKRSSVVPPYRPGYLPDPIASSATYPGTRPIPGDRDCDSIGEETFRSDLQTAPPRWELERGSKSLMIQAADIGNSRRTVGGKGQQAGRTCNYSWVNGETGRGLRPAAGTA